jgi:hypothetical protein
MILHAVLYVGTCLCFKNTQCGVPGSNSGTRQVEGSVMERRQFHGVLLLPIVIITADFRSISNCKWGFTRCYCHYDNTTHKCTSHRHNTHITYTQLHISHKITPLKTNKIKKNKSAHEATQTAKGILQSMNRKRRRN